VAQALIRKLKAETLADYRAEAAAKDISLEGAGMSRWVERLTW
jgi:hypothetical protein